MSSVRSRELTLSEVINESNLIVEVKYVRRYEEEVPITNRDTKNPAAERVPHFLKKGAVFNIKHILKNKDGLSVPETINVPDENWRRSMSQHKAKHGNSPRKSFVVQEYNTEVTSIAKATILFLFQFQGMYELTARNAFESNAAREKIDILIQSA